MRIFPQNMRLQSILPNDNDGKLVTFVVKQDTDFIVRSQNESMVYFTEMTLIALVFSSAAIQEHCQ